MTCAAVSPFSPTEREMPLATVNSINLSYTGPKIDWRIAESVGFCC